MKRRTLKIVIEEDGTAGGKGFKLYLEGDKERIQKGIKQEEMSPAEFWGMTLFKICANAVTNSGALNNVQVTPRGPADNEVH